MRIIALTPEVDYVAQVVQLSPKIQSELEAAGLEFGQDINSVVLQSRNWTVVDDMEIIFEPSAPIARRLLSNTVTTNTYIRLCSSVTCKWVIVPDRQFSLHALTATHGKEFTGEYANLRHVSIHVDTPVSTPDFISSSIGIVTLVCISAALVCAVIGIVYYYNTTKSQQYIAVTGVQF